MALKPRQEKFCEEYVKDLNRKRAYIAAGYSENGASQAAGRLLQNVEVKERVAQLQAKQREESDITLDTVLQALIDDREHARENNQVSAAIKATVEIARLMGFYELDNAQRSGKELGEMTTEELIARAKELIAKAEGQKTVH